MALVPVCGKKVVPDRITARRGWDAISAAAQGRIVEIKSPRILQPGPAALIDGLDAILTTLGRLPVPSRTDAAAVQPFWDLTDRRGCIFSDESALDAGSYSGNRGRGMPSFGKPYRAMFNSIARSV